MRTWTFDQWEFEHPDSEESLEVAAAARSAFAFSNVREFVGSAVGVSESENLSEPEAFDVTPDAAHIRANLRQFCGIDLPSPCEWSTYRIGSHEWNESHVVICSPEHKCVGGDA